MFSLCSEPLIAYTCTLPCGTFLIPFLCLQQFIPFAVIGSDHAVMVGGKKAMGRQTKWGFIEVENKKHCEFAHLRDMLIR